MNPRYFLPICFAAAAHGALLFGFSRHPRPLKVADDRIIPVPFFIPPEEDEPDVVNADDREHSAPKSLPVVPQPVRTLEPPTVDPGDRPTMQPPRIPPVGDKEVRVFVAADFGGRDGEETGAWTDVLSSVQLDNAPRARFQTAPHYPFEAKRAGMSGEVQVEFIVDERGRVIEPRVVHSSNRIFEEPTLRAVAKWQFEPGRRRGSIVKFRMAVPVMFNLNEGS